MTARGSGADAQSRFLHDKVVEHFGSASKSYAHRRGMVHPEADPIIVDFVRKSTAVTGTGTVLEVGGGSGYLLDLLAQETNVTELYNCELAYQAYLAQADSGIALIGGNALCLPFSDDRFDYVIAKNLLHHLVGGRREESRRLALQAVSELRRVAKHGGHIIILEQYHRYRFCADVLFYVTLTMSKGSFQWETLGIRSKVVVSFLTPSEIRSLLEISSAGTDRGLVDWTRAIKPAFPIRLFPFFSQFGRLLLIREVCK